MKKVLFSLILSLVSTFVWAQELTAEETKLYNYIMQYRQQNGLPVIPLSPSLTTVAKTHVSDLVVNQPDLGNCNSHSWSAKGKWTSCCYSNYNGPGSCIWDKPRELTSYKGNGYEIACGSNVCCSSFVMTADYALESWQKSWGHNDVILNKNGWGVMQWNAIGVAIQGGFACVWFGAELDQP